MLGLSLASACRKEPAVSPPPVACGAAIGEPGFERPGPLGAVRSQVTVEVAAKTSWISSRLESEVPPLLGEGQRSIGVPGRVTYRVHRGAFGFDLSGSRLVVSTPVTADVSLCKPIAGFCPTLGRCSPTLAVAATVPVVLGESFQVGKTEVRTELVRGCRILGVDASAEVESQAARETRKVEREIERVRSHLQRELLTGLEALQQPLSLGSNGCLRIRPERALQRTPRLEKGMFTTALTLEGTLAVEPSCANPAHGDQSAPKLSVAKQVPETHVQVPVPISWAVALPELTRTIGSKGGAFTVMSLRARGVKEQGQPRVLLGLEVQGVCGTVWMTARPTVAAEGRAVRLSDTRPVSSYTGDLVAAQLKSLVEQVQGRARVSVPGDILRIRDGLLGSVDPAATSLAGMKLDFTVAPTYDPVLVDDQGLVLVLGLKGRIRVNLQ